MRAMEQVDDLIRPWRRATIAVSAVAALELVALAVVAIVVFGNPLGRQLRESAAAAATAPKRPSTPEVAKRPTLARGATSVMVLNGNGRAGAAHAAAARVQAHGYRLGDVGNAAITAHTVVMYRPGYAAEGRRLGSDLHVRPLDGMRTQQLMGAHLVLILGT
jgi:hypothetical protein